MGVFTRDEEELLKYDGDAFFYFAGTMLLALLVPWTYYLGKAIIWPRPPDEMDFEGKGNHAPEGSRVRVCTSSAMEAKRRMAVEQAKKLRWSPGGIGGAAQVLVVTLLWICLIVVIFRLGGTPTELRSFDPYKILGISRGADVKEIKKAYRTKSLQHHPDKDRDNPFAHIEFQQVSKAYAALTDESARRNYEKYGNPDGPVQMKVGIALHPALVIKEYQRATLCLFFFLLFLVPFSVVCCCLRGSNLSVGGVCGETLRIYHACIDADVRVNAVAGLMAASVEARIVPSADMTSLAKAMVEKSPPTMGEGVLVMVGGRGEFKGRRGVLSKKVSDLIWEVEIWPPNEVPSQPGQCSKRELPAKDLTPAEPKVECGFSDAPIRRKAALLWAHVWRLHQHMAPDVRDETTALLRHCERLGRAMVSIAVHGQGDRSSFLEAASSILKFRRCLVQAIEPNASPLLQIPYIKKVPTKDAPTMLEVVAEGSKHPIFKPLALTADQALDVDSFCRHVPRVKLACSVEVNDEENVAEGDMATLTVKLIRTNLEEGESQGAVHAPYWPCPKFEEWWILVYDERARRLVTADSVLGTGRVETCQIRFMVPRAGDFRWTVHAMCDSYAGIDATCELPFKVLKHNEVNHDIFVHPADMNIRSFFEELMAGLDPENEDSESEDEEPVKAVEAKKEEEVAKPAEEEAKKEVDSPKAADDSDEEDLGNGEPEGLFYKVTCQMGAYVHREPTEDPQLRIGSVPANMVVRGFPAENAKGWIEMAWGGGAWLRIDGSAEADENAKANGKEGGAGPAAVCLGSLAEQPLRTIVSTSTPIWLVKRWIKTANKEHLDISVQDMVQVRDIEDLRARLLVEELVRKQLGDEKFEALLDGVEELKTQKTKRLSKALGFFSSANGIVWHVTPQGAVRGLHQDGNRIRDRVQVSEKDELCIGPFSLDESRTCSCIHWLRRDDPSKAWVWSRDATLRTRVRLGSAF